MPFWWCEFLCVFAYIVTNEGAVPAVCCDVGIRTVNDATVEKEGV